MPRLSALGALGLACLLSSTAQAQQVTKTEDGGYKIEVARSPAPAPAPAPAAAPAPAGDGSEAPAAAPASQAGGYAWKDPPRRARRPVKVDPRWAIATFPGFRMNTDGTSEISVQLSKKPEVEVRKGERTVTLVLKNSYVRWSTNTLPLITTHFNTPVSSARLTRGKAGETLLVIQLREAADVRSQLQVGPRGTSVLRVSIPKATKDYVARDERAPIAVLSRR